MIVPNTNRSSPSEHWEQSQFMSWWRKAQPDLLMAIPNGGKRSRSQAARLKLEGVHSGAWDLFAPERGLWIEFKRQHGGRLSQAQRQFGLAMLAAGYRCMVAYGCDDGVNQVEDGERKTWKRPKTVAPSR